MRIYIERMWKTCYRDFQVGGPSNFSIPHMRSIIRRLLNFCILPISSPFEHCVLRERVRGLNLLRDSLRKVNRYVGISK